MPAFRDEEGDQNNVRGIKRSEDIHDRRLFVEKAAGNAGELAARPKRSDEIVDGIPGGRAPISTVADDDECCIAGSSVAGAAGSERSLENDFSHGGMSTDGHTVMDPSAAARYLSCADTEFAGQDLSGEVALREKNGHDIDIIASCEV
jgi:hypothetical protein